MVATIGCDLCAMEPAIMMQTSLANGDTISVGQACITTFFASVLVSMLSNAPPEVLNDLAPALVPLAAIIGPSQWDAESDVVKSQPNWPADGGYSGNDSAGAPQSLDICDKCGKRIDTPNPDCPDQGGHKTLIGGYPVALDSERN